MHLCDKRFAGVAMGVGTAKILGRVHAAKVKIGNDSDHTKNVYLQCSFTIMEGKGVDLLLGLDNLKRFQVRTMGDAVWLMMFFFQACIDLKLNVLRIGDVEIPFLSEKDLPDKARHQELPPTSPTEEESKAASSSNSGGSSASKPPAAASTQAYGAAAPATASAAATTTASAAATTTAASPSKFPESAITSLTALGASRAQAISALEASAGNVDVAASLLFSMD